MHRRQIGLIARNLGGRPRSSGSSRALWIGSIGGIKRYTSSIITVGQL